MERTALSELAGGDARWPAARRLRQLRLGLGLVTELVRRYAALATITFAAVFAGVMFVRVAVARWSNFETNAFDLGFFDQIIYNTAQLRPGQTSFIPYNFMGQHLEPVLLLFVVPYKLGAGPLFLTTTQAVVVAAAAVPLYGAARSWRLNPPLAVALVAGFLLNPYLHRALNFDFHPEVMVCVPVFGAAWALGAGRPRLAAALALSTLLFKEDAALVVLAFAALLWWRGERKLAKRTAFVAMAWAAVAVLIVMPLARHGHSSDLVDRYGYLVHTKSQAALLPGLLLHPWVVLQQLTAPAQLWTAALFIAVSAPLALLRPWTLTLLLPSLALALLASHTDQRTLDLHYSAEIVPLAFVATVVAAERVRSAARQTTLAVAVAAVAVISFAMLSPLAPWNAENSAPTAAHRAAVATALALIPTEDAVVVSAQSGLLPQLSQRDHIYEFPSHADGRANWAIVDHYGFRTTQSQSWGYDAALAAIANHYSTVFDSDGVTVYRKQDAP